MRLARVPSSNELTEWKSLENPLFQDFPIIWNRSKKTRGMQPLVCIIYKHRWILFLLEWCVVKVNVLYSEIISRYSERFMAGGQRRSKCAADCLVYGLVFGRVPNKFGCRCKFTIRQIKEKASIWIRPSGKLYGLFRLYVRCNV